MTGDRSKRSAATAAAKPIASALLLCAACSGDGGTGGGGSGNINAVEPGASNLTTPLDAVPNADGTMFYYTALDETGSGAVFRVPCEGGTPTSLASGLALPVAIMISSDGSTIYVGDLGTETEDSATGDGAIYTVAESGGPPSELTDTRGFRPRALDLVVEGSDDVLYFTGNDPTSGEPGLFRRSGGAVTEVAAGDPFGDPSGVAVTREGVAYVADVGKSGARIIKIDGGAATELVGGLKVGYPAGVALSFDETHLLVSGINEDTGGAQVYRIELASLAISTIDQGISQNRESAGLHRARGVDKYVWVDSGEPIAGAAGGTVYELGTEGASLCQ